VEDLLRRFLRVRRASEAMVAHLPADDLMVQSMPDASPLKWHLAHTSWAFETFVLNIFHKGYRSPHPLYAELFNSYYNEVGPQHQRARRGDLSRPTADEVLEYRRHVDAAVVEISELLTSDETARAAMQLSLSHEEQHQELMRMDLLHALWCNPLLPAYRSDLDDTPASSAPLRWESVGAQVAEVGGKDAASCYDNETPRHKVLIHEHKIANRCVTNAEWLEFIRAGGYSDHKLWLSDGFALAQREGWKAPLYWTDVEEAPASFTLGGLRPIDPLAPVCHVSYYEADAFARWSGARLPTEFEWEVSAGQVPVRGNFAEDERLMPSGVMPADGPQQIFGDVWEWCSSAYQPYPGFTPLPGIAGEYNGKFMSGQMVLRGGSALTPRGHLRASYRNYFYPHQRWMMSGVRLAM
jgi:ergothioneine biosynthesis protein EgtB